jgi:ATP-binding cassette, subfamily B, bacterial PglK
VGIARALYHNPDLLVFEEATFAPGHSTEAAVNEVIEACASVKPCSLSRIA